MIQCEEVPQPAHAEVSLEQSLFGGMGMGIEKGVEAKKERVQRRTEREKEGEEKRLTRYTSEKREGKGE